MAELSFLTIIVSLAVCSLLIYAVFQYMKIRLTILEQSHKEQALILQQFIEESSTDIHRLYQLSSNNGSRNYMQPQDSIILEYANDFANHDVTTPSYNPVAAYNEPHIIHLDTALFKNNNKSNLIEISSDSEDTTDSGSESDSGSSSDSGSEGSESGSEGSNDGEGSESDSSDSDGGEPEPTTIHEVISEMIEVVCDPEPISDIKLVTVDLGAIQESLPSLSSSPEHKNDVLSMLYKKAQETTSSIEATVTDVQPSDAPDAPDAPAASEPEPESAPAPAPAPAPSLSSMSVPELRHLLKEKYKNNPEKHHEIQKLKKVELIYALQTTQS